LGLEFPPSTESENAATHPLFECSGCKGREMVDSKDHPSGESEGPDAVVRSCKRCGAATTWKRVLGDELDTSVTKEPEVLDPVRSE
jgi:hypothetical protein